MVPLRKGKTFSLKQIRRFTMGAIAQSLAVVLVLVLVVTGASPEVAKTSPSVQKNIPAQNQYPIATPSLPLAKQTRARLRHSLVTGASMTSHNLTAAYFFGHRSASKLSAETRETTKQG